MKKLFTILICLLCLGCMKPPASYAIITVVNPTTTFTCSDSQGNPVAPVTYVGPPLNIVLNPLLSAVTVIDKATATTGDVVTYTTTVTNVGRDTSTVGKVLVVIPPQMTVVPGSVTMDGVAQSFTNNTVVIPDLLVGKSCVWVFKVQVK
jgi:uncharacterized repeat protein (TIGR01451 family)